MPNCKRRWSPWHDLPLDEMKAYGPRLSPETIRLIEGFLGIEEYVGDYVLESLELFRNNRTRRNLQLQWGAEELKHSTAWELVLLHSGARTDEQIEVYLDKVREHRWSVKNHAGADTPLGVTIYSMVQERATFFNYQLTLRSRAGFYRRGRGERRDLPGNPLCALCVLGGKMVFCVR